MFTAEEVTLFAVLVGLLVLVLWRVVERLGDSVPDYIVDAVVDGFKYVALTTSTELDDDFIEDAEDGNLKLAFVALLEELTNRTTATEFDNELLEYIAQKLNLTILDNDVDDV